MTAHKPRLCTEEGWALKHHPLLSCTKATHSVRWLLILSRKESRGGVLEMHALACAGL